MKEIRRIEVGFDSRELIKVCSRVVYTVTYDEDKPIVSMMIHRKNPTEPAYILHCSIGDFLVEYENDEWGLIIKNNLKNK